MNTKLKPVIRYGDLVESGRMRLSHVQLPEDIEYLCLPLHPAARKAMIEAMCENISDKYTDSLIPHTMQSLAEAAIAALQGMAKEKP